MNTRNCATTVAFLLIGLAYPALAEDFKTIDNKTEVKREANDEATFNFTEKVDGGAKVIIRAPKGTIKFSTGPSSLGLDEGSKIDGPNTKLLLEAESISFNAKIGGESVVLIIVSKGGKIEVNDVIASKAQVYWCKADDNDPQPTIKTKLQNPRDQAKYNQVKRTEMDKLIKEHDLK